MKTKKQNLRTKKIIIGLLGAVVIGLIALAGRYIAYAASTIISVTVVEECGPGCTSVDDSLVDGGGNNIPPVSDNEFNITNPDVTAKVTIQGTSAFRATITNSAYTDFTLMNLTFSSGDPAYGSTGDIISVLPGGALSGFLKLGRNVIDLYATSSIAPSQDVHRQIIINLIDESKPSPSLGADTGVVDKDGNPLPAAGEGDEAGYFADSAPIQVIVDGENISRVIIEIENSDGRKTIIDKTNDGGVDLNGAYVINAATNGGAGLRPGKNIIYLTVYGPNGESITRQWIIYYLTEETPDTGIVFFGSLSIGRQDIILSAIITLVAALIATFLILSRKTSRNSKQLAPKKISA